MNKKIAFAYSDEASKKELEMCAEALKTVLRKFRKNVQISFCEFDLSLSLYDVSAKKAESVKESFDAVLWNYRKESFNNNKHFLRDSFSCSVNENIAGGISIYSPISKSSDSISENEYTKTTVYSNEVARHCAHLAAEYAEKRTRSILVCTDTEKKEDALLYTELENELGGRRNFNTQHYTFEEMLYSLIRNHPLCDTIVTTEEKASVVKSHLISMHDYPVSCNIFHSDGLCIYTKDFLAYDNLSCCAYASLLIAASFLLEKYSFLSSAGKWLRRCTALTLDYYRNKPLSDFQKALICEIDTPIRKRQEKDIDSKN